MTDKQIIIDGVDVSGCENYIGANTKTNNCTLYDGYLRPCKNADCYYKNWQRKEQECEELKEEIKKHNDDMFKNPPEKRFYCKGCTLPYTSKKLKQTLTEIKPILEFYANSTLGEEQEDGTYRIELSYKYGSSNMYGTPCFFKYNPKPARQALQKISECEGNDETN